MPRFVRYICENCGTFYYTRPERDSTYCSLRTCRGKLWFGEEAAGISDNEDPEVRVHLVKMIKLAEKMKK